MNAWKEGIKISGWLFIYGQITLKKKALYELRFWLFFNQPASKDLKDGYLYLGQKNVLKLYFEIKRKFIYTFIMEDTTSKKKHNLINSFQLMVHKKAIVISREFIFKLYNQRKAGLRNNGYWLFIEPMNYCLAGKFRNCSTWAWKCVECCIPQHEIYQINIDWPTSTRGQDYGWILQTLH